MRCLDRDRQAVYIARYEGLLEVVDEFGRLTGKHAPKRSMPECFYPTITAAKGSSEITMFGSKLDYDRVLTIDDPTFTVSESDVLWIDAEVGELDDPNPHDYTIKRIAKNGSYCVIAVKRVEVSR